MTAALWGLAGLVITVVGFYIRRWLKRRAALSESDEINKAVSSGKKELINDYVQERLRSIRRLSGNNPADRVRDALSGNSGGQGNNPAASKEGVQPKV